jgi:hypothetical protein
MADRTFVTLAWKSRKWRPWLFCIDRISEAATELGIKAPIKVGVVEAGGRYWTTQGTHRVKAGPIAWRSGGVLHEIGFYHQVTVKRDLGLVDANTTLWHELAHAMQAEHTGDPLSFYTDVYKPFGAMGSRGYWTNPFEEEANAIAAEHEGALLVKVTPRG